MASERFYLACLRDNVGTNVSFHCKDGRGYNTDIDRAHEYTLAEAQQAWQSGREIDLPLCANQVDALSEFHVDCQTIPGDSCSPDQPGPYVAYRRGRWDGNDVYWLDARGDLTTDFLRARRFSVVGGGVNLVWLPYALVDAVKRRTFSADKIHRRSMVQGAGLRTPDHIKRELRRARTGSGKTRWNCPSCGRIHWQHNPYDFEGCSSVDCELWRRESN